ncbi:MAG: cation-translocating P-type ATPase, partial [Mesorhizobium sp.]
GKLLRLNSSSKEMPAAFAELVEIGALASAEIPFDPMERAFHKLAQERLAKRAEGADWKLARAYGLRPELLAMSNAWRLSAEGNDYLIAAKGSPEAIAALCRLPADRVASLKDVVDAMATEGLRVLGVARSSHAGDQLPDKQTEFEFEFLGLVGLADPLRAEVPDAVSNCRSAGIRVIMITGDYPATARAIARGAGLDFNDVVTGEELKAQDDAALSARVKTATVFARIMPEQKLAIVRALKANGEIVAMTGDGVNDAPSLKAADIGIAMGGRGTDVAREASSIVLLDDDFGSIVKAIRLGRRIYDNLRKAMGFILAVHVPIAGLALLPLLFGLPILFGPIHIAFLEMVIDPVCSLVFEAETEEDDTMRRAPRHPEAALFSRSLIAWSVVQGLLAFALVAGIFLVALRWGMPENEIRALTFFSLVLTIVGLIFVNRTFSESLLVALIRPNRSLAFVVVVVAAALGGTLAWPLASGLFQFGPLHLDDLAVTLAAGLAVLVCLEVLKHFWRDGLKA